MTAQALLVAPGHPRHATLEALLLAAGQTVRVCSPDDAPALAAEADLVVLALDRDGVASAALCGALPYRVTPVLVLVGDPGPADLLRLLSSGAAACLADSLTDDALAAHLAALEDWTSDRAMRLDLSVDLHADRRQRVQALLNWVSDADGDLASERVVDRLVEGDRRAALGRLTEAVAHDFNNLLTVIAGRARLVLDRYWGDDATRAQLTELLDAADAATGLSRKLLAVGRPWDMGSRDLDLDAFLAEVRDALAAAAPAGVTVILAPMPPDTRAIADPARLEQVLVSLGLNALDAVAEAGGQVELSVAPCDRAGSPGVAVSIRDTGAGMSPEVLGRAFEPFFSTRGRSGLGLATARQVVASLDGTLSVETGPGQGTTLRVELSCPAESTTDPTSARPDRGPCEVLVVEDEDGVRILVAAVLRRAGFRVHEASTAEEALAATVEVDLLITDLALTGLSGKVLAQRMRVAQPNLRVLYTSGHTGAAVTGSGVDLSGPEFLQKPFTPDILVDRVRRVLR
jgi:signal transduction histidine kinase